MGNERIPVVFGLDQNYILQAFVVMRSVLLHSKESYHFFLLTADAEEGRLKAFGDILQKEFPDFKLTVKKISRDCFADARIYNEHISVASYFRLMIPKLLKEYEKCIYLDCDLIVYGDLKELYGIRMGDHYLAGVKDCHIIEETERQARHRKALKIPSFDRYINAGVLLMNLKKMRRDNLMSAFFEQIKRENWYEDQDVLNFCCYPYVEILPLRFNLFHFYLGKRIKFLYHLPYEESEFAFDSNSPFALHMGGSFKPWMSFGINGSHDWWDIAKLFHTEKEYRYYRQICRTEKKSRFVDVLIKMAKSGRRIIVWGYGKNGRRLCDLLWEYHLEHNTVISDNNPAVWGEEYKGISVQEPDVCASESGSVYWLVTCGAFFDEVAAQIQRMGADKKNIFYYTNPFENPMYLLSLNREGIDREIENLIDMEYIRRIPDRSQRKDYIKRVIKEPFRYEKDYKYLAEKYNFRYWI